MIGGAMLLPNSFVSLYVMLAIILCIFLIPNIAEIEERGDKLEVDAFLYLMIHMTEIFEIERVEDALGEKEKEMITALTVFVTG